MYYDKTNYFTNNEIQIVINKNSLYDNLKFRYYKSDPIKGSFSPVHHIHNKYTPLHNKMTISIDASGVPDHLKDKALIASIDNGSRIRSFGGKYLDGFITSKTNRFGSYLILADTVPPWIRALNFKKNDNLNRLKRIEFIIADDLSGINTYDGYFNDEWVLFEYDSKRNLIFYTIDNKRLKGDVFNFRLEVTDVKNNKSFYKTKFYR
jgi:hypothetical protein